MNESTPAVPAEGVGEHAPSEGDLTSCEGCSQGWRYPKLSKISCSICKSAPRLRNGILNKKLEEKELICYDSVWYPTKVISPDLYADVWDHVRKPHRILWEGFI